MKRWNTAMNGWSSARGIARVANSLTARRSGFMRWMGQARSGLGRREIGVVRRAGDRRHGARGHLARLAGLRRLDEQLCLLDPLRRDLGRDALGGVRVAIEQVPREGPLREAVEEALRVEEALL